MPKNSDHWYKKLKTAFKVFDCDKDGCLTKKDAEIMAKRFIDYGSLERHDAEPLMKGLADMFDLFFMDNPKHDTRHKAKEPEFVKVWEKTVGDAKKKKEFEQAAETYLRIVFKCLDIDGNGQISRSDFNTFLRLQFGKTHDNENDFFEAMDLNSDGVIDLEEYKKSFFGFWFNMDEGDASFHFGPLAK